MPCVAAAHSGPSRAGFRAQGTAGARAQRPEALCRGGEGQSREAGEVRGAVPECPDQDLGLVLLGRVWLETAAQGLRPLVGVITVAEGSRAASKPAQRGWCRGGAAGQGV